MSIINFLDSIKLTLEHQHDHARKDGLGSPRLFITLSRQPGAGAIRIGEKTAEFLNNDKKIKWRTPWKLFDKELVKMVIEEHHLPENCEKYMPEGKVSPVQDILDDLFGVHPPAISLVHKTNETLLHLAHLGNVIIVGRGGPVITRKLRGGFHVRLVGSFDKRFRRVMEFSKLSEKEAKKLITEKDKGRKKYFKEYFNKDIDDPLLYDLLLNTDHLSYDQAAKMITHCALCSCDAI